MVALTPRLSGAQLEKLCSLKSYSWMGLCPQANLRWVRRSPLAKTRNLSTLTSTLRRTILLKRTTTNKSWIWLRASPKKSCLVLCLKTSPKHSTKRSSSSETVEYRSSRSCSPAKKTSVKKECSPYLKHQETICPLRFCQNASASTTRIWRICCLSFAITAAVLRSQRRIASAIAGNKCVRRASPLSLRLEAAVARTQLMWRIKWWKASAKVMQLTLH